MNIDLIVVSLVCFSLLQIIGLFLLGKKSFHSLAIATLLLVSVCSLSFYLIGSKSASYYSWTIPLVLLMAVILFWVYYHQYVANITKAIVRIKQLAGGNFKIDTEKSNLKNELGVLNNSILLLSLYLRNIVSEIKDNSESMDDLFCHLKNLLDQMAEGEKDQEANLKEISADLKEVIALLEKLFLVDEKRDVKSLILDKKITSNQYLNVSYADITSKIDSTSTIITLINILSRCVEVEATRANGMQRNFKGVVDEFEKISVKNKRLSGVCQQML
jgi:methyl-accepting chemotaxis protein